MNILPLAHNTIYYNKCKKETAAAKQQLKSTRERVDVKKYYNYSQTF